MFHKRRLLRSNTDRHAFNKWVWSLKSTHNNYHNPSIPKIPKSALENCLSWCLTQHNHLNFYIGSAIFHSFYSMSQTKDSCHKLTMHLVVQWIFQRCDHTADKWQYQCLQCHRFLQDRFLPRLLDCYLEVGIPVLCTHHNLHESYGGHQMMRQAADLYTKSTLLNCVTKLCYYF